MPRPLLFALLAATLCLTACNKLYELPDPPPRDQWTNAGLDPAQDQINSEQNTIAARQAVLTLYASLSEGDWDSSWELLSAETQNFLSFGHPSKDGKQALAEGKLTPPGGEETSFDPVDLFVINDLRSLEDDIPDAQQAETANRKELFATSAEGQVRKIVVIREAGAWRVQRTELAP